MRQNMTGKTTEDLQAEAVDYFRGLKAPVKLEVWAIEEVAGAVCADGNCGRVGFVSVDGPSNYCVEHASLIVHQYEIGTCDVDVCRPVIVPDGLTAGEDPLLELVGNFLYFVADSTGSNVTVFMSTRATALGNRCKEALKARALSQPN